MTLLQNERSEINSNSDVEGIKNADKEKFWKNLVGLEEEGEREHFKNGAYRGFISTKFSFYVYNSIYLVQKKPSQRCYQAYLRVMQHLIITIREQWKAALMLNI